MPDQEDIKNVENAGFYGVERFESKRLVNKYGLCPNCGENLDGGDMFEEMRKLQVYHMRSTKELEVIAGSFGWTPENKARFTRLIAERVGDEVLFYKCPNNRCGYVFHAKLGWAYENMQDALADIPTVNNPEDFHKRFIGVRDIDNIEIEGEKAIADMNIEEIKDLIERIATKYYDSKDAIERRNLKRDYLELVAWYNEETQTQAFKIIL